MLQGSVCFLSNPILLSDSHTGTVAPQQTAMQLQARVCPVQSLGPLICNKGEVKGLLFKVGSTPQQLRWHQGACPNAVPQSSPQIS